MILPASLSIPSNYNHGTHSFPHNFPSITLMTPTVTLIGVKLPSNYPQRVVIGERQIIEGKRVQLETAGRGYGRLLSAQKGGRGVSGIVFRVSGYISETSGMPFGLVESSFGSVGCLSGQ